MVAPSTRPSTRSGCWRHTRWATTEPIEYPPTRGSRSPSCSITAAASSAQSASEKLSEQMPRPCQRWSIVTTRKRSDSGAIAGYQVSRPVQPTACSSRIAGEPGSGPGVSVTHVVPRPGSSSSKPAGIRAQGM